MLVVLSLLYSYEFELVLVFAIRHIFVPFFIVLKENGTEISSSSFCSTFTAQKSEVCIIWFCGIKKKPQNFWRRFAVIFKAIYNQLRIRTEFFGISVDDQRLLSF